MRESRKKRQERAAEVVRRLAKEWPDARCSLHYKTPHQLLVATILSAQCTDERVNQVCKPLFRKYRSPRAFASVEAPELAVDIHSCGYHNQKARSIVGMSRAVLELHGGQVPRTMEELVKLPGVGRKTANCILGEVFGVPSMVIDTHMIRIMNLLGFGKTRDAVKLERELMDLFEPAEWVRLTHRVIEHGRAVCIARRPACARCVLADLCPSAGKTA